MFRLPKIVDCCKVTFGLILLKISFNSYMKNKNGLLITFIMGLVSSFAVADSWQASWIGLAQENSVIPNIESAKKSKKRVSKPTGHWTCFRKDFQLDQAPRQAVAKIAVDSKYWLWINGKMVVLRGNLNAGPVRKTRIMMWSICLLTLSKVTIRLRC